MKNVDSLIAETVYSSLKNFNKDNYKKLENLTNKALAVLLEAGLFSSSLFLKYQSRGDFKDSAEFTLKLMVNVLKQNNDILNTKTLKEENPKDHYETLINSLKEITQDIYLTVFATNTIYQTLVYLRYHLKTK